MKNILRDGILYTISQFYPAGVDCSDPLFERSEEWLRQTRLRGDGNTHALRTNQIEGMLRPIFPAHDIDDNSCPSLYPSYHLRVLLEPPGPWPRQDEWNWDLELARKSGRVAWFELFFCYLAPYYIGVATEFKSDTEAILLRRSPAESSQRTRSELQKLRKAFEEQEWTYVPSSLAAETVLNYATDTGGLNERTVFDLLFSDTYPSPLQWTGVWQRLESAEPSVEGSAMAIREGSDNVPIGRLIMEASVRNSLGTLAAALTGTRKRPLGK